MRRGSQRPPGSAREPVTKPGWRSLGSPIQMLGPNHPPRPGVVPRLGGSKSFTPSANPPLPTPPRAGRCCHRPPQPGPGALSPAPPEREALYRRSLAPSTPLRSPERSPQPGGSQSPPAAPHLPAARSLPSSRSPARPALTSHLRAGRSRRRPSLSRARRPALSFVGQSQGPEAPAGHRRAHAAMFVQGTALPAHAGEGWVCTEGTGGAMGRERGPSSLSPGEDRGQRGRNMAPTPVTAIPPLKASVPFPKMGTWDSPNSKMAAWRPRPGAVERQRRRPGCPCGGPGTRDAGTCWLWWPGLR